MAAMAFRASVSARKKSPLSGELAFTKTISPVDSVSLKALFMSPPERDATETTETPFPKFSFIICSMDVSKLPLDNLQVFQ